MDIELNVTIESVDQTELSPALRVDAGDSVRQVIARMKHRRIGTALVCRGSALAGIFTERDVLRLLAARADLDEPISAVMTPSPITLQPTASIGAAIRKMAVGGYRRLPVVDSHGAPIGVLETSGIVRFLVEHFPRTIYNLPPVPHPAMQQREGS